MREQSIQSINSLPYPHLTSPDHIPQSIRKRTRQKQQFNLQSTSANPLFRKVREFKKDLINNKLKSSSHHTSNSGTSLYDIHFIPNHQHPHYNHSPMETKLLHLLSKQNKKIDSYLQILQDLYDNKQKYDQEELKRIQQLCYTGVGKTLVDTKKIEPPSYSRVNLLIREFMIDSIERDTLDSLKQEKPRNIYIECNATGLGYKTALEPQYKHFSPIITSCNKIVEQEFLGFKKKKEPKIKKVVEMSSYVNFVGILLLIAYFSFERMANLAVAVLAGVMLVTGVGANLVGLIAEERVELKNSNVIDKIQERLEGFLREVNEREDMKGVYEWRCGKDFYWLEVIPQKEDSSSSNNSL